MGKGVWNRRLAAIAMLLLATGSSADDPLVVVTDLWPPYTIEGKESKEGNESTDSPNGAAGTDVEIVKAVFHRLGMSVNIQFCPWMRCLMMVRSQEADAILGASHTQQRTEFLYYPEEPVSEGATVFFVRKGREVPFATLSDLDGLKVGALIGYQYCDAVDQAGFMRNAQRSNSLARNFKQLLAGRLDVVVEVDAVGFYTAEQMGISDRIDVIPGASYCHGGNYLGFAKKPGYDQVAARFSDALRAFKSTDQYTKILRAYGREVGIANK